MEGSIRRLPPETASRIAAGEVIERPLSALKEVLENALDAGARSIEVRVERALDHLFAVADDGDGIRADELELALERHATSKIALPRGPRPAGLAGLPRRGPAQHRRGEPPARSPAAPPTPRPRRSSRSRAARSRSGARRRGRPGTTVEVADLFFNTPARRKFLTSPTGELRAALRLLEAYALAFPQVAFRLLVDGKQRLRVAGGAGHGPGRRGGTAPRRCGARATPPSCSRSRRSATGLRLEALLGLPEHARATREGQIYIVNGRWIQSPMLGAALRQAYGNLLPAGALPGGDAVALRPARAGRRERAPDQARGALRRRGAGLRAGRRRLRPAALADRAALHRRAGRRAATRGLPRVGGARARGPARADLPRPGGRAAAAAAPATAAPPAAGAEPELWQLHRTYVLAPVRGRARHHRPARRARAHPVRGGAGAAAGRGRHLAAAPLPDAGRPHERPVRAAARAGAVPAPARLGPLAARAAHGRHPGRALGPAPRAAGPAPAGRPRRHEREHRPRGRPRTSRTGWRPRGPATPRRAPATPWARRRCARSWTACSPPRGRTATRTAASPTCASTWTSCTGASAGPERWPSPASSRWWARPPPARPTWARPLAAALGGEVVCADSRQVFRELEIGTGKPSPAQRAALPHHLFDALALGQRPSAGWYATAAGAVCAAVRSRGRVPVLVGGSGLWLRAAERGLSGEPPHDAAVRAAAAGGVRAPGPRGAARPPGAGGPGHRRAPEPARPAAHHPRARSARGQRAAALVVARAPRRARGRGGVARLRDRRRPGGPGRRASAGAPRWMLRSGLVEETRALVAAGSRRRCGRCAPWATTRPSTCWRAGWPATRPPRASSLRTRQLAKRQRTWFRHQVEAVRLDGAERSTAQLLDAVLRALGG